MPFPPPAEGNGFLGRLMSCEGVVLSRALSRPEGGIPGLLNGEVGLEERGLPERLLVGREPADLEGEGWPETASEGLRSSDEERGVRLIRPDGNLEGLGSWAEGNRRAPGERASRDESGDRNRGGPGDCAESASGV